MELTRRDQILKLIVEEFITDAEPVGSKTLIEKFHLPYSSATVRNDMMELEKLGLIEKTHASSGRVPSSAGYRYYVEHLQAEGDVKVDAGFKKEFQMILAKKSQSVEDIMDKSCKILSEMTNLATVVLGADAQAEHLISISIVPLSSHAATAIFVTDRGYVENKTFVIRSDKDGQQITNCVDFLNKRLAGTPVSSLGEKIEALRPIISELLGKSSDLILESLVEAFMKFAKERIYATGAQKLIAMPEYDADKDKLQNVLDLINSPEKFREAIEQDAGKNASSGVTYTQDADDDLAIVSENFSISGLPGTKVAVVGPQRMNYKKVIGTLEYIAEELNKYFALNSGGKQVEPVKDVKDVSKEAKGKKNGK